jgi:hypothetical protein
MMRTELSPQALRARQLGINTVIVLEQLEELPLALEAAARLRVRPALGVRGRLATHHKCATVHAGCKKLPSVGPADTEQHAAVCMQVGRIGPWLLHAIEAGQGPACL